MPGPIIQPWRHREHCRHYQGTHQKRVLTTKTIPVAQNKVQACKKSSANKSCKACCRKCCNKRLECLTITSQTKQFFTLQEIKICIYTTSWLKIYPQKPNGSNFTILYNFLLEKLVRFWDLCFSSLFVVGLWWVAFDHSSTPKISTTFVNDLEHFLLPFFPEKVDIPFLPPSTKASFSVIYTDRKTSGPTSAKFLR